MSLSFVPMPAFAYGDVPMEPSVEPVPAEGSIIALSTVPVGNLAQLRAEIEAVPYGVAETIELTTNIDLTGAVIPIPAGRDITLTGGYTLTRTAGTARHFLVDGILRLEDITISGRYPDYITTNHGGVTVNPGGSLFMEEGSTIRNNRQTTANQGGAVTVIGATANVTMSEGSVISGNSSSNNGGAGAVFVGGGALFTMNGGEISGNSITGNSTGGVYVLNNWSTFIMNDGVIRNNIGRFGGGARVGTSPNALVTPEAPRMYMHGGEIYGNRALFGGAVNVEWGTLTMTEGVIRNNTATAIANTGVDLQDNRGGGGVLLQNGGVLNMSGGTIRNNMSYNHGGGVMSNTGNNRFNMTGGTIQDNTAILTLASGAVTPPFMPATGGGVRMTNGIFTLDGGTITGNTATNDGGGIWLGTGTAIVNARLNLEANTGTISNNTSLYGNGGGIFTVANNSYPLSLLATHYPNLTDAVNPFEVTFFGNSAGGGKFEPPLNPGARPFGNLLNNYDINYVGQNQVAIIAFLLNGGYVDGSPASIIDTIPLTEALEVPEPEKPLYELIGWIRYGDPNEELLTAEDIEAMTITGSMTFIAQWYPLDPITITYLSGTDGTFVGSVTSSTELLIASGGYPIQVPAPIANDGFQFIGWSRDGGATLYYTSELMMLFIDEDTTFTAHWEQIPDGENVRPPLPPRPPQNFPSRQAYLIGTNGYIRPSANITRAEVATIFFRLIEDADRAANWTQTNPFSDVALENWFNNAISTTTRMGIFQGRPDGTFAPNQAITRGEFAAAVARFAEAIGLLSTEEDLFNDIYGHWANAYINAIAAKNWVQGSHGQGGAFYPDRLITRAETAAILNRMFGRLPESPADLLPNMHIWPDNADSSAWYYLYLQAASNSYTYELKTDGIHERWIAIIPVRNWAALERPDSVPEDIF